MGEFRGSKGENDIIEKDGTYPNLPLWDMCTHMHPPTHTCAAPHKLK